MKKYFREIRGLVEAEGVDVTDIERRRGGHIAIHTPNGLIFCASTPSDRRWRHNMRSVVRRMVRDR